jgi:hypothetical protein
VRHGRHKSVADRVGGVPPSGRCSSIVYPVVRSTRVPIAERLAAPVISRVAPAHCC